MVTKSGAFVWQVMLDITWNNWSQNINARWFSSYLKSFGWN
jgi:hypothetical protein